MMRRLVRQTSIGAALLLALSTFTATATATATTAATTAATVAVAVAPDHGRQAADSAAPAGATPILARAGAYHHVSIAIDGHGHVQAVAAGDTGIWFLTDASGTFKRKRITTAVGAHGGTGKDDFPSIALDATNHAYVAFVRWDCFDCAPNPPKGIYYVTNKSGSWSSPTKLAGSSMDDPTIQVHGGHISVSWQRCACIPEQTEQVWFGTDAGGSWTKTKVAENASSPSLALNAKGKPRIAFVQNGIRYAVGATTHGNFTSMKLAGTNKHDRRPALALTPSGLARVAWSRANAGILTGVFVDWQTSSVNWIPRHLDTGTGSISLSAADEVQVEMSVAENHGGALLVDVLYNSAPGVLVSASSGVDGSDVSIRGGRAVWMYTVTYGDPVGIYEVTSD